MDQHQQDELDSLSFLKNPNGTTSPPSFSPPPAAAPPPPPNETPPHIREQLGFGAITADQIPVVEGLVPDRNDTISSDHQTAMGTPPPRQGSGRHLRSYGGIHISDGITPPSSEGNNNGTSYPGQGNNMEHAPILWNANATPNTGQTNSADGETISEMVFKMRMVNLICATLAILCEVPSWLGDLFKHPGKLVLGVYLAFFSGLLCCFELHTPFVARHIRDNFGLLYSTVGRAIFIFMMGGMSMGQGGLEVLIGLALIANSIYTLYLSFRFPDYQKAFEKEGKRDAVHVAKSNASKYAWANPGVLSRFTSRGHGESEGLINPR